jgi:hypothetical protein
LQQSRAKQEELKRQKDQLEQRLNAMQHSLWCEGSNLRKYDGLSTKMCCKTNWIAWLAIVCLLLHFSVIWDRWTESSRIEFPSVF